MCTAANYVKRNALVGSYPCDSSSQARAASHEPARSWQFGRAKTQPRQRDARQGSPTSSRGVRHARAGASADEIDDAGARPRAARRDAGDRCPSPRRSTSPRQRRRAGAAISRPPAAAERDAVVADERGEASCAARARSSSASASALLPAPEAPADQDARLADHDGACVDRIGRAAAALTAAAARCEARAGRRTMKRGAAAGASPSGVAVGRRAGSPPRSRRDAPRRSGARSTGRGRNSGRSPGSDGRCRSARRCARAHASGMPGPSSST